MKKRTAISAGFGQRIKQCLSFLLAICLLLGMVPQSLQGIFNIKLVESTKAAVTLNNPRIVKDSRMEAGQKVTWDCVWFGSYPQTEIVDKAESSGCYGKSWAEDKDYEVNANLYSSLKNASYDRNGDTMIGNTKYRRLKSIDATNVSDDGSYDETSIANYYRCFFKWASEEVYHYFRYEPIKWRVLEVNNGKTLLLSDVVLDDQRYYPESETVTWETSTLRSWLNGYDGSSNAYGENYNTKNFISSAFSNNEKNAIETTSVLNENDNNTADKIFLLSESEVRNTEIAKNYGFVQSGSQIDEARRSKSSTFAKAMGVYTFDTNSYLGNCYWWLRSPGVMFSAGWVYTDGYVNRNSGCSVYAAENGVRPALNLNLSSSNLWSYAGTVCSDGTMNEVAAPSGGNTDPENPDTVISMESEVHTKINNNITISAELKSSSFVPTATNMTWHLEYNNGAGSSDITIGKMSIVNSGVDSYIISSVFNFKKAGKYEVTLKSDDGASATCQVKVNENVDNTYSITSINMATPTIIEKLNQTIVVQVDVKVNTTSGIASANALASEVLSLMKIEINDEKIAKVTKVSAIYNPSTTTVQCKLQITSLSEGKTGITIREGDRNLTSEITVDLKKIFALTICGINNSQEGKSSYNDANLMYNALRTNQISNYQVESKNIKYYGYDYMTNPSSGIKMNEQIESAFQSTTDNDLSFFYFSGHSINADKFHGLNLQGDNGTCIVCYTYKALAKKLDENIKGKIVVILDCCFAQEFIQYGTGKMSSTDLLPLEHQKKFIILCASTIFNKSYVREYIQPNIPEPYGLYTFYLGKGIGYFDNILYADTDNNKKITVSELCSYVQKGVKSKSLLQQETTHRAFDNDAEMVLFEYPSKKSYKKIENTIEADNIIKSVSANIQSFNLNAKCKDNAQMTYTSNNMAVSVDKNGKVNITEYFVGTATITIKAEETADFKETKKTITITVYPSKTTLSSVKNIKGKKMKVTWKKIKQYCGDGYQIQYSTNSKFASGNKTVTIKKNSIVSKTISKLKKGKTYYVRVRTYKFSYGKNYYSGWSNVKKVKIKK